MQSPRFAVSLYLSSAVALFAGIHLGAPPTSASLGSRPRKGPLARGQELGEVASGVPRLDPDDAMANAALLMAAIGDLDARAGCTASPRHFTLLLEQRVSRVRFSANAVCQLRVLKQISVAQPGFGRRGLAEVAAFVLGRRAAVTSDVEVSRIIVPPFRFTGDTVTFAWADLGPLLPGEQFIGTYHTHPEDDIAQGVLSDIDLRFMTHGVVDFHGEIGRLASPRPAARLDWLFDIVEPRDGEWNVYAHDRAKLAQMSQRCGDPSRCPVNELRLAGSPYYLLTRHYDERVPEERLN